MRLYRMCVQDASSVVLAHMINSAPGTLAQLFDFMEAVALRTHPALQSAVLRHVIQLGGCSSSLLPDTAHDSSAEVRSVHIYRVLNTYTLTHPMHAPCRTRVCITRMQHMCKQRRVSAYTAYSIVKCTSIHVEMCVPLQASLYGRLLPGGEVGPKALSAGYYEGVALKPPSEQGSDAPRPLRGWYQVHAATEPASDAAADPQLLRLEVTYEPNTNDSMPQYQRTVTLAWQPSTGTVEETQDSVASLPAGKW